MEPMKKIRDMVREALTRMVAASQAGQEEIMMDFAKAKKFANERLKNDIPYLENYFFSDYLPKNDRKEQWSFELMDDNDVMKNIAVVHFLDEAGTSKWRLTYSDSNLRHHDRFAPIQLQIVYRQPNAIAGYNEFIASLRAGEKPWAD